MSDPFMKITGVSLEALIAAFIGGAASMLFVKGGFVPRAMSLVIGVICAVFLSPYFFALAKIFSPGGGEGLERAVVFLSGFLGMVFLGGVYAVVDRIKDRAAKIADKALDKIG